MKAVFTFCYFWAVLIDGLSNVERRTGQKSMDPAGACIIVRAAQTVINKAPAGSMDFRLFDLRH